MNSTEQKSYHVAATEKFIDCLRNGTGPQQLSEEPQPAPFNPVSGIHYSGINRLTMAMSAFKDPRWMTERQLAEKGLRVAPDSKPTPVMSFDVASPRPVMNFINVFNAEQVVDMPSLELESAGAGSPLTVIEDLCRKTGADIYHDDSTLSTRAVYWPRRDSITLPTKENVGEQMYCSLALHTLAHWTGHFSRLDREDGPFGSTMNDREELRVEIATWMLSQDLGIPHLPDMHRNQSVWIDLLEKDPDELLRICRDAEQIKNCVLGFELAKEQKREKVFLNVPSEEKSTARALGAGWDSKENRWFIPDGNSLEPFRAFKNWLGENAIKIVGNDTPLVSKIKTFINVPFKEMKFAQALGAKWDAMQKSWFVPEGMNLNPFKAFENWMEKSSKPAIPVLNPQEEFAERLREAGLVLNGSPVMDGTLHRLSQVNRERGQDAAYSGTLGENPSGKIFNFATENSISWTYSGHTLSKNDINKLCENKIQYDIQSPEPALHAQVKARQREQALEL